jgi:hypothetical protein
MWNLRYGVKAILVFAYRYAKFPGSRRSLQPAALNYPICGELGKRATSSDLLQRHPPISTGSTIPRYRCLKGKKIRPLHRQQDLTN